MVPSESGVSHLELVHWIRLGDRSELDMELLCAIGRGCIGGREILRGVIVN